MVKNTIQIEVSYCLPSEQVILPITIERGSNVLAALEKSQILDQFNLKIDGDFRVGIFGKKCPLETVPQEHDRIEIYRPLLLSPTEARKLRARTAKNR